MSERSIFLAALDLPDFAARQAYLDDACAGNSRLRQEIEALLQSHEQAGSFLGTPAAAQIAAGVDPATAQTRTSPDTPMRPGTGHVLNEIDNAEAAVLALLSPTEKPGALGRLAHYEVYEVLGRGAFGVVLKAFDEKLHRMVAIKAMNPELAITSPPRKRFLREARSAAAVKDEHIVSIYAVEEQPIPYLVMEYVPGKTLQMYLDEHGPLDLVDVLQIGQQIAIGLAAAHEKGLIHRDIKPANILLETGLETKAKLTDFGLARAADDASLTQSGLIAGTPLYMAPEQARGQALDHRADLFSLGSVLYTMVCGRPPFRAPNTMAVLKRVCEDTPRPITELVPEAPPWLCAIIARLHAKEPADRFASAEEVATLLTQSLQQVRQFPRDADRSIPVTHAPLPAQPHVDHPNYLHPLLLLAVSGIAAICGCGIAMGTLTSLSDSYLAITSISGAVCTLLAFLVSWWLHREHKRTAHWPGQVRPADGALLFGTLFLGIWCTCLVVSSSLPQQRDLYTSAMLGIWMVFYLGIVIPRFAGRRSVSTAPRADWLSPTFRPTAADLAAVQARLQGPGRGLILTAIVNWIGLVALIVFAILVASSSGGHFALGITEILLISVMTVSTTLILLGGLKMCRGESYGWCLTASLLAILIGPVYFVGWPVALWSLIVLSGPDVRAYFRRQVSMQAATHTARPPARRSWSWGLITVMSLLVLMLILPSAYWMLSRSSSGTLIVQSNEPFVSVMIDGGPLIDLPGRNALEMQLPGGRHTVVFIKEGQPQETQTVTLQGGQNQVARWPSGQTQILVGSESNQSAWKTLLNTRDVSGWMGPHGAAPSWTVEQRLLVGKGGQPPLISVMNTFDNFVLVGEVRLNKHGQSDIFIRVPSEGPVRTGGDEQWNGFRLSFYAGRIFDPAQSSPPGPVPNPPGDQLVQPNVWSHFRIHAVGQSIMVWIDGVQTISAFDATSRYRGRHVALSAATPHTRVEYRNLAMLPLPGPQQIEPAPSLLSASPNQDDLTAVPVLQVLFNGKDLSGWMTHPDEPGQWRVEEGVLVSSGSPSCLFTERNDFTDFVLHAEVSINLNGDGGILVRSPYQLPGINGLPGYEAQIQSGRPLVVGWTTGAIGQSDPVTGWRLLQPTETDLPSDEFVPLIISARGSRIETSLAGRKVAEYVDPVNKYPRGRIALQQSGPDSVIRFRKLEVYELRTPQPGEEVSSNRPEAQTLFDAAPVSALEPLNKLVAF